MPTKARDSQGGCNRACVRTRPTDAWHRQYLLLAIAVLVCVLSSCTGSRGPEHAPKNKDRAAKPATIEQAFLTRMSEESVALRMSGTGQLVIRGQRFPIDVDLEGAGSDTYTSFQIRIGETEQLEEEMTLAGGTFISQNNGPWVRQSGTPTAGDEDLSSFLRSINNVRDIGTEIREGEELHHLQPPRDVSLDAAALGLTDESIAKARGRVDFYVKQVGTPVIMSLRARWRQTAVGKNATARVRMTSPADWEVSRKRNFDLFRGTSGEVIVVGSRKQLRRVTLNEFTGDAIRVYNRHQLFDRPTGNESILLKDSVPGRLLTYRHGDGAQITLLAVTVYGLRTFEITMPTESSRLHEDRAILLDFLTTFSS